jgi:hypothetical protein
MEITIDDTINAIERININKAISSDLITDKIFNSENKKNPIL